MPTNARRGFIYALLFTLLMISMLDRVNTSVADSLVAKETNLNPTALGYLFSSFLWIYVLCLLPWGAITHWLGTRRGLASAIWISGSSAGPLVGALSVSWLVTDFGWRLAFIQGCMTYTAHFFLTWLPSNMRMARGFSIMRGGVYTALPFGLAIIFCVAFSYLSDRAPDSSTPHSGSLAPLSHAVAPAS